MITLKDTYGEDADEIRAILEMFSSEGKKDAEIIRIGRRVNNGK